MAKMDSNLVSERFKRVWDRFSALERVADERMSAQAIALHKAETSLADYKLSNNAYREMINDLTNRLLPKTEYESRHATLVDKVNSLDARILQNSAIQAGRSSGISAIGYTVMSVIGAFVGIASITSILVTLLHTPNPSTETTTKLDALSNQLNSQTKAPK